MWKTVSHVRKCCPNAAFVCILGYMQVIKYHTLFLYILRAIQAWVPTFKPSYFIFKTCENWKHDRLVVIRNRIADSEVAIKLSHRVMSCIIGSSLHLFNPFSLLVWICDLNCHWNLKIRRKHLCNVQPSPARRIFLAKTATCCPLWKCIGGKDDE